MEALKRLGSAILGIGGAIVGSTIYIAMLGLMIFSVPLNVIAIMHLWGYEWWSALLLGVFIGFIPIVGQIAYMVFAVMGAYYFYQADFNWREATRPSIKTFEISKLSAAEFDEYKKVKLHPEFVRQCIREGSEHYGFQGKIPTNVSAFCECYADVVIAVVSKEDLARDPSDPAKTVDVMNRLKSALVTAKCKPVF